MSKNSKSKEFVKKFSTVFKDTSLNYYINSVIVSYMNYGEDELKIELEELNADNPMLILRCGFVRCTFLILNNIYVFIAVNLFTNEKITLCSEIPYSVVEVNSKLFDIFD